MIATNERQFFLTNSGYYTYDQPQPFLKRLCSLFIGIKRWAPYCRKCQKWATRYEPMLGLPVTDDVLSDPYESNTVKSLFAKDWSTLNKVERLHDWAKQPAIYVSLARCEACNGPFGVLGDIHGKVTNGPIYLGSIFSIEIDNWSCLELLETAIERNLLANPARYKKAVDFCKALGSTKDFAQIALKQQRMRKAMEHGFHGMTELNQGKFAHAEDNLESARQIFEKLGDRKGEAVTWLNLATVSCKSKQLDQAETRYLKATQMFEELGEKTYEAEALMGLGLMNKERNELDRAETFTMKSMLIFEEVARDSYVAIACGLLGDINVDLKNFDKARSFYCKALEKDTKLDNKVGMATAYHSLGAVYKNLYQLEQARNNYSEALRLARELGNKAFANSMQAELDRIAISSKAS